ncbi:MAG TPA: DUF6496 domain-containing protein [Rhizomicrobium sp.]|jgi:hypothetical protein|nr:DUF6496 domain-containing protein [Rhizomicrobium sp.]
MAKTSPRQRKSIGRVMHEYKHGELKRSRGGKGGKVKSRKQAIAIALHEGGASKSQSESKKRKAASKSRRKESQGRTYQQRSEGKSHVGARGRAESSRAVGGKNATRTTKRGRKTAAHRQKSTPSRKTARKSHR